VPYFLYQVPEDHVSQQNLIEKEINNAETLKYLTLARKLETKVIYDNMHLFDQVRIQSGLRSLVLDSLYILAKANENRGDTHIGP
jgi:hypothetical protein